MYHIYIYACGKLPNSIAKLRSRCTITILDSDRPKAGLTEKPLADPTYEFSFPDSEKISPPVLAFQKA